ncbi:MAG: hypothetical protein EOM05_10720 [Clostridia bacterium]|nr:hypothetical protein [Clostridia bacterium]
MATIWAYIKISNKSRAEEEKKLKSLIFRIRHAKEFEATYTSNLKIRAKDWDKEAQQVRASFDIDKKKRLEFNKQVLEIKEAILSILNPLNSYDDITSKWLNEEITKIIYPGNNLPLQEEKPESLLKWVNMFVEQAPNRKDKVTGRLLVNNNVQQYKATQKHLNDFAKHKRKKDFLFKDLDQKFYDAFVEYLQGLGFTANSVGKHIRILKLMLNEATKLGFNTSTDYTAFYVFNEEVDTIYITEEELSILKEADLTSTPYLDRVRDWFLLLAWTGCRFSDLEKIGKTDIKDGFITFRQQKTNTKVTIPLHPVVSEILQKYEYKLPAPITNQRFNEYIKEVARRAKIDNKEAVTRTIGGKLQTITQPKYELISSHTGRRSFCTNMYKRGLPTLMIMSISGHKTEKSFLKYIKVKQEEHAQMMAKAWQEMYK